MFRMKPATSAMEAVLLNDRDRMISVNGGGKGLLKALCIFAVFRVFMECRKVGHIPCSTDNVRQSRLFSFSQ